MPAARLPTAAIFPTAAEAATFQSQGAVALHGVFKDWVEVLRAGIERNIASPGDGVRIYKSKNGGRFFGDYCNWARIPEFEEFILSRRLQRSQPP